MNKHHIGKVCFIDFTTTNKKRGFEENSNKHLKSAFIHFKDPWMSMDNKYYFDTNCYDTDCYDNSKLYQSKYRNTTFWDKISEGKSAFKLYVSEYEYWLCFKNRNPIKRTLMNIHQVVDNCLYLEDKIREQEDKIFRMQEEIDELKNIIKIKISY
jgi:hypothetical protein